MTFLPGAALPSAEDLLSIIRVQTEIARLGRDLDAVMGLAATACMELTAADGAAVEIIEGPLMVYRAAAGSALSLNRHGHRRRTQPVGPVCAQRHHPVL